MTGVSALFVCHEYFAPTVYLTLASAIMFVFVVGDLIRQKWPALNEFAVHAFGPILRESEINRLAGTTYLLSGVVFVSFLFPHVVVSLTLLFLAFADPLASYVGLRYGKEKIFGPKTLQGFFAAFFTCSVITVVYFYMQNFPTDRLIVIGLIAGMIGALAELFPIGKLDDNLTMPLLSAFGLTLLFYFFDLLVPSLAV